MRLVTLFLIAAFAASTVGGASYQKVDGTIVDPIMYTSPDWPHPYSGADLRPQATLRNADLTYANLYGANLSGAVLTYANLYGADLTHAILTDADLTSANLANANLNYANLIRANLSGADLYDADLRNANLTDTDLRQTHLSGADLRNANLTDADLRYAYLTGTDLRHANLTWAKLAGANLSGSNLSIVSYYHDATWIDAFYYADNVPDWASGMDAVWRDSVGILAITPNAIPEPTTLLLALLAMAAAPLRVRCG